MGTVNWGINSGMTDYFPQPLKYTQDLCCTEIHNTVSSSGVCLSPNHEKELPQEKVVKERESCGYLKQLIGVIFNPQIRQPWTGENLQKYTCSEFVIITPEETNVCLWESHSGQTHGL